MLFLPLIISTLFLSFSNSREVGQSKRDHLGVHIRTKRTAVQDEQLRICGLPGRDGRDGRDGIQGPFGPPGPTGSSGAAVSDEAIQKSLNSLVDKIAISISEVWEKQNERLLGKLDLILKKMSEEPVTESDGRHIDSPSKSKPKGTVSRSSPGGAVYTRWGRNVCPGNADALYSGHMAGSDHETRGDGTNHLCLPTEPQWNRTVAGHQSGSYIYGTEFEVSAPNSGFFKTNSGGVSQHNHDAQCVVCHTPSRSSHVMIPARLECPSGWTLEYMGFIMAQHHTHKPSEYVCIDQDPDVDRVTSADLNGNLLYHVEAKCGSLPCPNYGEGYELTCVVCTR